MSMLWQVKQFAVLMACVFLVSCGGNSGGGTSTGGGITPPPPTAICTAGSGAAITISGDVTFDRVPHSIGGGLDYSSISVQPVRGVVVEALCNTVIATATTDPSGHYSLSVPGGAVDMYIRVKAQMQKTGTPSWDFKVIDNTSNGALYSLYGSVFNTDASNLILDLHARSGWGVTSYTSTRSAGPFAILDSVYVAFTKILAENSAAVFPALNLNWSVNNNTFSGSTTAGQIGSSYFDGTQIFILGKANDDSDEYDDHVVIHEWAHYFESNFSRSDSIGGMHGSDDVLDIRLAFGEGFGNAYSAMASDDPIYADAGGNQQANGLVTLNMEANCNDGTSSIGWYSECSVQSILYDLYDATNDGSDTLSMGFTPLYNVLVGAQKNTAAMTSIFSFIHALKQNNPGNVPAIDTLLLTQSINNVADEYGSGQAINPTASLDALPVYATGVIGGAAVEVCSSDEFQVYNGYEGSRFVKFTVASARVLSIVATRTSGTGNRPFLELWKNGQLIDFAFSSADATETMVTPTLDVGDYVLEIYDYGNNAVPGVGSTCYNISM